MASTSCTGAETLMFTENEYQQFLINNTYPRELKSVDPMEGSTVLIQGKKSINFSSSDYLGLSRHPALIARAHLYAQQYGIGSSASRLVTGNFSLYASLEKKLGSFLQKPAAIILGSGYQTNIYILEALLD